jgi:hypothetical protein
VEMEVINEDPLSSAEELIPHIWAAPARFGPPLSNDSASLTKHPAILPKADRVSLALVHEREISQQEQVSKEKTRPAWSRVEMVCRACPPNQTPM